MKNRIHVNVIMLVNGRLGHAYICKTCFWTGIACILQFVYSFSSLKFHCHTFLYIIDTFLIMFQKYDLLLKQLIVILSKNSSEERVDYSAQVQDSYSSSSISMNRSIEISMNLSIPSDRCDASFGFLALNLKKKMKNFYSLLPFSLQMDV